MALELDDFRRLVEDLSVEGAVLTERQWEDAYRACHAITCVQERRVSQAIAANPQKPLVRVYMNDGWSARVIIVNDRAAGPGLLRIRGVQKHEFLLERSLFRMETEVGRSELHMTFGPPRPLEYGKTAGACFSAAAQTVPLPRQMGHEGLLLNVLIFDGTNANYLQADLLEGFFEMQYESMDVAGREENDITDLMEREATIKIRCKVHGANKGVEWGLKPLFDDTILDDCFISLKSCLRCMGSIHCKLPDMMQHCGLAYVDRGHDPAEVRLFWQLHDIPKTFQHLFEEVDPILNIETNAIEVNVQLAGDPRAWEKVSTCLFICRRLLIWSLTRWGRVGKCGRFTMRALLTGLAANVQEVFEDKHFFNENLNGFRRLSPAVRRLLAVASLACLPVEELLLELLKDDMFLKRFEELREKLWAGLRRVALLPNLVWSRIAVAAQMPVADLYHEVNAAMMRMYGFAWRETFAEVLEYPLLMTQGDIEENVNELERNPNLSGSKVMRRWSSYLASGSKAQLCSLLRVLSDSSTTCILVEEGHAQGQVTIRDHAGYSASRLQTKTLLKTLRAVVRQKRRSTSFRQCSRLLRRLAKKRPRKAGGKQLYFRAKVADRLAAVSADPLARRDETKSCMRTHGAEWRALTPLQQHPHRAAAQARAAARVQDIENAMARLRVEQRRLQREEDLLERQKSSLNHVAAVRMSEQTLQDVCDTFNDPACKRLHLGTDRSGAWRKVPPAAEAADVQVFLEAAGAGEEEPDKPWICRTLCRNRNILRDVAIGLTRDGNFWQVLFAKEQPHEVTFLELRREPRIFRLEQEIEEDMQLDRRVYDYLNPPVIRTERDCPFPHEDTDIFVRSIRYRDGKVVAPSEAMFLELWLGRGAASQRAPRVPRPRRARPRARADVDAALLAEFPGLSEDDLRPTAQRSRAKRARPAPVSPEGDDVSQDVEEPVPDDADAVDDAETGDEEQELVEFEWDDTDDVYFYTRVGMGKASRGQSAEVPRIITGFARACARTWCVAYGFPQEMNFTYTEYGVEVSAAMAREYCRRGHYFIKFWVEAAAGVDVEYTQANVDSYVRTEEWTAVIMGIDDNATRQRAIAVDTVAPRLGPV